VRPEELKDVVVLATIKGGRTYFRK
jgi:hypothetical protein